MSLNVPILFICYKRFDYVKETLSKILEFKPNKLYISIDGSRDNNDIQDVIEVKKTIEELKQITNKTIAELKEYKWQTELNTKILMISESSPN